MTNIYLIRHAEAEGNFYRIAHGQYNSILTDRGEQQVEALRRRFEDIPIDAVYSSDLYRTCATARAIYAAKGLPLQKRADLREVLMGPWEQMTWGEIERRDPQQMIYFNKRLDLWHVEGAETAAQVRDRMLAALRDIAAKNPDKTVAVFSHGAALRITLGTLQGLSLEEIGDTPHGDNTAVSLIEAEGDELRVVFRDDNSHLKGALSTFAGQTWWKRPNGIEPGLYFQQVDLKSQGEWLDGCGRELWQLAPGPGPYDKGTLFREAVERPVLCAYLEGEPLGLVQMNPEKGAAEKQGWISLYYVLPKFRGQGYGVQLLGQAVKLYRPLGREVLRIALPETTGGKAQQFFSVCGFRPVENTADGRQVWEKDIRYKAL